MQSLTDEMLIQSYHRAIDLQLSSEFIQLLFEEICKRDLHPLLLPDKPEK